MYGQFCILSQIPVCVWYEGTITRVMFGGVIENLEEAYPSIIDKYLEMVDKFDFIRLKDNWWEVQ